MPFQLWDGVDAEAFGLSCLSQVGFYEIWSWGGERLLGSKEPEVEELGAQRFVLQAWGGRDCFLPPEERQEHFLESGKRWKKRAVWKGWDASWSHPGVGVLAPLPTGTVGESRLQRALDLGVLSTVEMVGCVIKRGLPLWLSGKESACNAGDPGSIPESRRSLRGGHGNPLQYSCLENPHGQRSLEGYSQQGRKESDTSEATEHPHM